jgi:monovalent cation/hydrogen antiporter
MRSDSSACESVRCGYPGRQPSSVCTCLSDLDCRGASGIIRSALRDRVCDDRRTITRAESLGTNARAFLCGVELGRFCAQRICVPSHGVCKGDSIIVQMAAPRLREALAFAGLVVAAVVVTRLVLIIGFNRLTAWWNRRHGRPEPASLRQALLVGWSGMRGFVTLATAFALPSSFPQRDLVVLTAFSVVLATLVVQGLTLAPLIRLLKLDSNAVLNQELTGARACLAKAALTVLQTETGEEVENLRYPYLIERDAANNRSHCRSLERRRGYGLTAIAAERAELERLRGDDRVGASTYLSLQEELDWSELTLLSDNERRIEES